MYIETLVTPHPERFPDSIAISLQLGINQVINEYAHVESGRIIQTAVALAGLVNRSLHFNTDPSTYVPLSPKNVSGSQTTNCFGYTVVLSECFKHAEIPHFIGYINGHALTIVEDDKKNTCWLVDAQAPHLSGPTESAVSKDTMEAALKTAATLGRGAVKFCSNRFLNRLPSRRSPQEMVAKYPWLSIGSSSPDEESEDYKTQLHKSKKKTLILGIYEPDSGRDMLEAYSAFQFFTRHNQMQEAYAELKKIGSNYPEIDSRTKPSDAEHLIRALSAEGSLEQAIDSVAEISKGVALSRDPRHAIWQADQLRKIGHKARNVNVITCAMLAYDAAATMSRYPAVALQKKAKAERLRDQILQARS